MDTFLMDKPADKEYKLLIGRGIPAPHLIHALAELELLERDPVRQDIDLIPGDLKDLHKLVAHIIAAADHPPCLIPKPPLHIADVSLQVVVKTVVSAPLGRMYGRHNRDSVAMLQCLCRISHKPVMGMYQIEGAVLMYS
jgi:hypothetical protein